MLFFSSMCQSHLREFTQEELPMHNFYMCIHVWDWDVFETPRLCSQTNLIQPLHANAGSILF